MPALSQNPKEVGPNEVFKEYGRNPKDFHSQLSGRQEQVLEGGLEGYADYKKGIRYKVIPFVW